MKIIEPAIAGTLESGDAMIRIAPTAAKANALHINSSVKKQFGEAIRATAEETLKRYGVQGAELTIDDKGALECVLKARLETALARAAKLASLPWEEK